MGISTTTTTTTTTTTSTTTTSTTTTSTTTTTTTQEPTTTTTATSVCDFNNVGVLFTLDASGSVGTENFDIAQNFVADTVELLDIGADQIRVAGMMFHAVPLPQFDFDFSFDRDTIADEFRSFVYPTDRNWGTATGAALNYIRTNLLVPAAGNRDPANTVVYFITDGNSQEEESFVQAAADALHATGARVVAIGITDAIDEAQLQIIASSPDDVIIVEDFANLDEVVRLDILQRACATTTTTTEEPTTTTTTTTTSTTSTTTSTTTTEVEESTTTTTVTTTGTPFCTFRPVDVLFILDNSGSVGEANFDIAQQFVIDLVDQMQIGASEINVAAMLFNSSPSLLTNFDDDKQSIKDAINSYTYPPGNTAGTATGAALNFATDNIIQASAGYRGGDLVVYVITDGQSQEDDTVVSSAAATLHNTGAEVIVIGITGSVDETELNTIATAESNVYLAENFENLDEQLADDLLNIACQ